MKPRSKLVLSATLVLVIAWTAYHYRLSIKAWGWHLRHGTTIMVNGYVVPVPKNWYVEDQGNGDQLLVRLDTDDRTPYKRLKAHTSILLLREKPVKGDLDSWMSLERNSLKQRGVESISDRTFNTNGEALTCLGGDQPGGQKGLYDLDPISWRCKSPGGLEIMVNVTEPDLNQAWNILSHIRKKS